MSEQPVKPPPEPETAAKRRFLDRTASTPTVIGAGTVFVGNMRGFGPFVISGAVQGDGELLGDLSLAVGATWLGNIRAERAIVAGQIVGSLEVEDKLEIGHTAVIRGRVCARTVAIARGAIVDGDIDVTSGTPVVQFEEKRDR